MFNYLSLIFFAAGFVVPVKLHAQQFFSEKEIPALLAASRATHKMIFVDVYADWCGPCKEMDKTVFRDSTVLTFFKRGFYGKKLNKDSRYKDSLSRYLKTDNSGVPSFYFVDERGSVVLAGAGLKSADELIAMGHKALENRQLGISLHYWDSRYPYIKGNKDSLRLYMDRRKEAGFRNGRILQAYLKLFRPADYLRADLINTIIRNETELNGTGYRTISVAGNRHTATQLNKIPGIGYDMYKASLDIINDNAYRAYTTHDKVLLNKCMAENMRVMQNKGQAREVNAMILKKFKEGAK